MIGIGKTNAVEWVVVLERVVHGTAVAGEEAGMALQDRTPPSAPRCRGPRWVCRLVEVRRLILASPVLARRAAMNEFGALMASSIERQMRESATMRAEVQEAERTGHLTSCSTSHSIDRRSTLRQSTQSG